MARVIAASVLVLAFCVHTPVVAQELPFVPTVTAGATVLPDRIEAALAGLARDIRAGDPNVLLWLALVAAIGVICSGLGDQRAAGQPVPDEMRRFGEAFVREFEQPLLRQEPSGHPAIQARLRADARQRRLEVLLAPAAGRRYPNLSDHKTNVEYDIGRVLRRLRVPSVLGRAPYAQGRWVVCPFEFADTQQAGGQLMFFFLVPAAAAEISCGR